MPASKTARNGILDLAMLPFTIVARLVFFPVDLAMWIIVDKLGDDKGGGWTFLARRCLQNQKFVDISKYAKEFRYVLNDYARWPRVASPAWRCKGCSGAGKYWCVDCGKKWCAKCCYHQHLGTVAMGHSIEEIKTTWKHKGVHVISPILPEILVALCLLYGLFRIDFFGPDYLTTQISCPMVSQVRHVAGSVDTILFYHWKASFFSWCNSEDTFLRFVLDAWLRTIVTETDNTLLVFQTLPQAFLFNAVLMVCLCPLVSVLYAMLWNLVFFLESKIPRDDQSFLGENLVLMESIVQTYSIAHCFGLGNCTPLPETHFRMRAPTDVLEGLKYRWERITRHFRWTYRHTLAGLQNFAYYLIAFSLAFRLTCIWLGIGPLLRLILSWTGFGWLITAHEHQFGAAKRMLLISEPVLWNLLGTGKSTVSALVPRRVKLLCFVWVVLCGVFIAAACWVFDKILRQRRSFWINKEPQVVLDHIKADMDSKAQ